MKRALRLAAGALVALGATRATAQTDPPRDTIVIGRWEAPGDTVPADAADSLEATPRQPSRWGAPFAVESRGRAASRRSRGEVVWVHPDSVPRPPASEPSRVDSASEAVVVEDAAPSTPARVAAPEEEAPARRDTARAPRSAPRDTARAPTGRPRTHRVAAGETFFGIARRYGVTTAQLRVLNPDIDSDGLEVGTVLRLPATARTTTTTTPPGRTTPPARPPTPARPAAAARRTHTVQRGETLFGVARRYGVSADAIMRANRLESDQLKVGQTLVIPR